MKKSNDTKHYEESALVPANLESIFDYIDDHSRFSSHMSNSTWMMGGGKMDVSIDDGQGKKVGSHIRMKGKAFGLPVSLDEIVTQRERPNLKTWETVGIPRLIVVGSYQMKIELKPQDSKTLLSVSIDYDPPFFTPWLGKLFGDIYAKWCVHQMIKGVKNNFASKKGDV